MPDRAAQKLGSRYWLTDKAIEALDGRAPLHVPEQTLRELVADLVRMDADGAIDLASWSAAAALVDAAYPVREIHDVPTGGLL